jgi:hypothetical protein
MSDTPLTDEELGYLAAEIAGGFLPANQEEILGMNAGEYLADLARKATPGPWVWAGERKGWIADAETETTLASTYQRDAQENELPALANAALIVAQMTSLPLWVALYDAARDVVMHAGEHPTPQSEARLRAALAALDATVPEDLRAEYPKEAKE